MSNIPYDYDALQAYEARHKEAVKEAAKRLRSLGVDLDRLSFYLIMSSCQGVMVCHGERKLLFMPQEKWEKVLFEMGIRRGT